MKLALVFCVFLAITLIGIYPDKGPGKEKHLVIVLNKCQVQAGERALLA